MDTLKILVRRWASGPSRSVRRRRASGRSSISVPRRVPVAPACAVSRHCCQVAVSPTVAPVPRGLAVGIRQPARSPSGCRKAFSSFYLLLWCERKVLEIVDAFRQKTPPQRLAAAVSFFLLEFGGCGYLPSNSS